MATQAPPPTAPWTPPRTPTINEALQAITKGVVHVVGDGGSSTGIVVDKRGYIITSSHIRDSINNVDVWLPDGRMVGGHSRYSDWQTGLALVELKKPDTLDLEPIHLEPLVSTVVRRDHLIAVSLSARDELASGTRVEAGRGIISDLTGNEWFRLDTKPPMASVGGPVLSERFGQIIGITVLKEVAGEVDTFALTLKSLQRQIDTLVARLDGTPRPADAVFPRESVAVSDGWTYFTRNCREGWTNCEHNNLSSDDRVRVVATAFSDDNDATGELPDLEFQCQKDGSFRAQFHPNGLEFNENDSGIMVGVWIDGVERRLFPVGAYTYPYSTAYLGGHKIARLFYDAELTGRLIEVGSLSYEGKAIGVFDPMGFRSNYWRLPCAR